MLYREACLTMVLGAACAGCLATLAGKPLPAPIPPLAIDPDACEVVVRGRGNEVPDDIASDIKKQAAEGLEQMSRARGGAGAPSRFRMDVTLDLGFTNSADVKLLLEVGDQRFLGEGEADTAFGTPKAIIEEAIVNALNDAARHPVGQRPAPATGGSAHAP